MLYVRMFLVKASTYLFLSFFCLCFFVFWLSDIDSCEWYNFVLLDVSKSMLVRDVYQWWARVSRLDWAKHLISRLSKHWCKPLGLWIFSEKVVTLIAPTFDKEKFRTLLSWINTTSLSWWGDSLSHVLAYMNSILASDWVLWTVYLLTDWVDWKMWSSSTSFRMWWKDVIVGWMWSLAWWPIDVWNWDFLEYEGDVVISVLASESLRDLASQLWWKYIEMNLIDDGKLIDRPWSFWKYRLVASFLFFLVYLYLSANWFRWVAKS